VLRILLIFLIAASGTAHATHIIGGEIYYDFLGKKPDGKDIYRVTLKLYRDCSDPNNANFEGIAARRCYLSVRSDVSDTLIDIGVPVVTQVPSSINSPCVKTVSMCVQEGTYTYTLELEPVQGGYYVIYQGCCRNTTILNILQPVTTGATYYTRIPGPEDAVANSSPRFKNFPPIFLCTNVPFNFEHIAIDPDGDQLEYAMVGTVNGRTPCCPEFPYIPVVSPSCPSPPSSCPDIAPLPPYPGLFYLPPYSAAYPLSSSPSLAINPVTGKLSGTPNSTGQFVVSIEVKEVRNGIVLNRHYRDFQFNVVTCEVSVLSEIADQPDKCAGATISFTNQSFSNTGALTFHWDFGDPGKTDDTSNVKDPVYTYQDTGVYEVTLVGYSSKSCADTVKKKVHVYPKLDIRYDKPADQCLKSNSFSFSVKGSYLSSATFTWNLTALATPSVSQLKNPTEIKFSASGTHKVRLYGRHLACIDSFIDSVRVLLGPKAVIGNPPLGLCVPALVQFSNESSGESMQATWIFSDGTFSEEFQPAHRFSVPGVHGATLTIITTGGCKDTSMASVRHLTVNAPPQPGFILTPKVTTIMDPMVRIKATAGEGLLYEYDFGDGFYSLQRHPDHVYYESGNYTITQYVSDFFGCRDSVKDIVQVLPEHRFWIPDAFTPDDSGRNDEFRPFAFGVASYRFQVYDRWGNLLFSTAEPAEGWNGTYNGKPCKQDIYVYSIRYVDEVSGQQHERSGHISLLRNP
jgi:gliding motility-associated-like protein